MASSVNGLVGYMEIRKDNSYKVKEMYKCSCCGNIEYNTLYESNTFTTFTTYCKHCNNKLEYVKTIK